MLCGARRDRVKAVDKACACGAVGSGRFAGEVRGGVEEKGDVVVGTEGY